MSHGGSNGAVNLCR